MRNVPSLPTWMRPLLAGLGVAGIAVWLVAGYGREKARQEWAELLRSADEPAILATMPPHEDAFVERARLRGEHLFPPDRSGAMEDLAEALKLAPMKSRTWFHLARNHAFRGQGGLAREAMARADALDPWFPGQRLRAVQFWSLLGDTARAEIVAASLAEMGPRHRRDAVRELFGMGISIQRAWELVGGSNVPADEAGRLLLAFGRLDGVSLTELVGNLPAEFLADPEFQRLLYRRAGDPFLPHILLSLWQQAHGPLVSPSMLPVENGELDLPPFRDGLPLGWLPPAARAPFQGSWVEPQMTPDGDGVLRMELPMGATSAAWPVYRTFPAPEWSDRTRLTLRVRAPEGGAGNAWITVRNGGNAMRSASIRLGREWSDLMVDWNPAPGFVEVVLDIRPIDTNDRRSLVYQVGSLRVEAAE